ncbi:unnamed protein product [Dibothriocephalus latus]|uniref:Uncharacterized protein n=1 Tax=Dibothriocephalus latus TaxID=60516 RepID=A0A3P6PCE9_DIBLA|nr:unnamed protein product [Dibothriocephalus latus]
MEKRLTGFRYYFPFNRPEAALENLLILMERVSVRILLIQALLPAPVVKRKVGR